MMPTLYPLRLRPVLQDYLWGGTRLASLLSKPVPEGATRAESWEVVDHPDGQSVVDNGPLAGQTLGAIARDHGKALYGDRSAPDRFPLLLKYLDANKTLSVQVHPNDTQAARQSPPDLGKTEAWLVLAAEPGSKIYAGLREGVDRAALELALHDGTCDHCLHTLEPAVGDCVFIPAGTVHALGAGLVIAEIQQASNTTFRLFDWNRVDKGGEPRALHIDESLAVTDFNRGPVFPQRPERLVTGWERLVACDKFVFDRRTFDATGEQAEMEQGVGPRILTVSQGSVRLRAGAFDESITCGSTVLLPALCDQASIEAEGPATVLSMRLP